MNRMKNNPGLQAALNTAPDFSIAFTQEVMSLHRAMADELGALVEHDDDMNYGSSQKLVVWLDAKCHALPPRDPKATYRLMDFVSSRGRFFALVTLGLFTSTPVGKEKGLEKPSQYWAAVADANLPDGIKRIQKKIASIMKENNYTLLDESVLAQQAEGHWTKLDGRPATIFEALFSEMY